MPDSFDGFCSLWPEADPGEYRMRGMHPPPAIFENAFDVYNFFIILNLFDSKYALCLEHAYSKMREQNASLWVKHLELG